MKSETWRRIDDCLADALELPVGERAAYLELKLAGESEALAEALKLVGQAERAEKLFEKGPVAGLSGLVAGSRLGPWELVKPLGSGGMGVVWLARRVDGQATMMAAIKMLPPALSGPLRGDNDLLQRFLMEKQILARLQHPNIARLLDASAGAGETPNFVMEYVEGVPLMEYLKRDGVDRLRLFLKICEAVQYAHANLIIHRDLKPQNVLVDNNGEPKLLDFGIGKILNDPAGDASITLRRAFSLDYASPEQIRGGVISTATDVYSLGLILFEMMTGERARRWNDKALGEVLAETDRFVLPARAELSADLVAVLGKATAIEEGRRYGSVGEFAADVERVVDGRPVEARAAGLLYQVGCFARRNRVAVGVSVVALGLILGLGIWGWVSAGQAEVARGVAEEKSRQLQASLVAERMARAAGDVERRKAEEQSEIARGMEDLAEKREQQAEERLKDVLRVFDSLIVATRRDIAKLPGGTGASIQLMERALKQLEGLQASAATRANYLLLRAAAHGQLAEMYGGSNSNVGDKESSARHRMKYEELWSELHRLEPGNLVWEQSWLTARFARVLSTMPVVDEDRAGLWKSFEGEFQGLMKRAGGNRMVLRAVGSYYFRRAFFLPLKDSRRRVDLEAALGYFEKARGQGANDSDGLRDLALTHKYLVNVAGMPKDLQLAHAKAALELDRQRADSDPNDAAARMDLAFSMNALADADFQGGRLDQARDGYWGSYQIRKAMAESDPNNVFVSRALIYPIRMYGVVLVRQKDYKTLEAAVREFEWAAQRTKATDIDLGLANHWRGLLAGDSPKACWFFEEALRLIDVQKNPLWQSYSGTIVAKLKGCQVVSK